MLDREDRIQHLALLTVVIACQSLSQSCPSARSTYVRTKSCEQTDAENMSGQPTHDVVKIELAQGRLVRSLPGEPSRLLENILVLDNDVMHGLRVERVQHVALYKGLH